ncbi:MAG: AMP-binding protein [Pseudomonadales bacterium]
MPMTRGQLHRDNLAFAGTGGVSAGNRCARFHPAFRDAATGQVERARFADGSAAPMHVLDGLPDAWVAERDVHGNPCTLRPGIVAGFVRDGVFYTREQAAAAVADRAGTAFLGTAKRAKVFSPTQESRITMPSISLSRLLKHWADLDPDGIAVVHEQQRLSWTQLEAMSNRLARAYQNLGVGHDDFVTIALPNGIEFFAAAFATWKLGATPQPVSARLPRMELEQIIEVGRPKLVVGAPEGQHPGVTSLPAGFQPEPDLPADPLPERTATYFKAMTSGGSTGRPKLIVSHIQAAWDPDAAFMNFGSRGSVLVPGPLYHNGPFLWALVALFKGNRVTITTRFDAERTLALIEAEQVDTVYLVPTMMQRIWNLPEDVKQRYRLDSLRCLWHLAAPCPAWLKRAYIDWLGADVIWELYGGTEGQGSTVISGSEWLEHPGSVGRPVPTCEIKIVDEHGATLPAGIVGEVFLRPRTGPGTTYHYIGAEPRAIDGGWESIGDLGYLDEAGYLYLSDRRTDMILSGGANVYPAEVEAAIDAFPGVRSSAVIGLPHEDLGNAVHAIVDAPAGDVGEEALLAHLAERLVRYKLPRSIEFVSEPLRDDAGKVRRTALRAERLAGRR